MDENTKNIVKFIERICIDLDKVTVQFQDMIDLNVYGHSSMEHHFLAESLLELTVQKEEYEEFIELLYEHRGK